MLDRVVDELYGVPAARGLPVLALLLARTAPLCWLAPWLGLRGTALLVRGAVAATLAVSLTPLALQSAPPLPTDGLALALLAVRELLLGATFAVAASVPLHALGWTGALVDRWRGSPAGSTPRAALGGPLRTLHVAAGVALFVMVGGHRLALRAFARGLSAAPVGSTSEPDTLAAFALGAARLVTSALELTLAFALPAVVAFVALEVVLAIWARAAPSAKPWIEGMPLRAALGAAVAFVGLWALAPRLGGVFARSIAAASELLRGLGG